MLPSTLQCSNRYRVRRCSWAQSSPCTPLGSPLIEKAMAELNPVPAAAVNLTETEAPRATLAVVRLDESVNVPVTFKLSA